MQVLAAWQYWMHVRRFQSPDTHLTLTLVIAAATAAASAATGGDEKLHSTWREYSVRVPSNASLPR